MSSRPTVFTALRSTRPGKATLALATALALVLGATTAGAAAAAGPIKKHLTAAATTSTSYTHTKTESFATVGWWKTWNLPSLPWHTQMITEGTNEFLRVNFPAGSHNGTSFDWSTGSADSAHIQYRMRLSANWYMPDGKLPGFGNPTYNADGTCSGGCGLAAADGITSWSGRGHLNARNVPGGYFYTPDKSEWGFDWYAAPLVPGTWYTIDYWVTMNTPGQRNGIVRAAINGKEVLNWTNMNLRLVDTLHVGTAWFGFYYGGTSVPAQDMWIDVDDVTINY